MVKVVNMVGSGSLDLEIDLETLSEEIGQPRARYDPDKYPGHSSLAKTHTSVV
ncbi:hypothetical protein ACOZ32_05465 [Halobacterium sp. MBLA0001]|uniref:hypothetical protein n=1 Tax=Halobacterium sp. MBLA0001 TaxID=3413511 RepID=UPI003C73EB6A